MNYPVTSRSVEEKSRDDSFLSFHGISCTYGSVRSGTVTALSDVNLNIRRGEFVVILGPSGSGKSTMLRLANGMTMAASGGIVFDGIDVTPEHLPRIRPRIGTIHQQFHLVGRSTVIRNVLCGILPRLSIHRSLSGWFPQPARKKAAELLAKVGLDESHFFRPARSLSGGQQQRAAIARAFMLDPELILADEPVASLDPPTGREILALLRTFARENGTTVLCSLHQIEMALEFGDRLIGLNGGKIVFDGRPGEIDAAAIESVMGKIYEGAAGASPAASRDRGDIDHMSEARLA